MTDRRTLSAGPLLAAATPLFGFWVVLSGKLDAFHLGIGLLTAVVVAAVTQRVYRLRPVSMPGREFARTIVLVHRPLAYLAWLLVEILLSAIHVARIVLNPRLPIRPTVVTIADALPHPVARLTLAHSITLTPGTVTIGCDEDSLTVHALDARSAAGLGRDGGAIADRVRRLYAAGKADH